MARWRLRIDIFISIFVFIAYRGERVTSNAAGGARRRATGGIVIIDIRGGGRGAASIIINAISGSWRREAMMRVVEPCRGIIISAAIESRLKPS